MRDSNGRFVTGNKGGPGRPRNKRTNQQATRWSVLKELATLRVSDELTELQLEATFAVNAGVRIESSHYVQAQLETLIAIKQAATRLLRVELEAVNRKPPLPVKT